MPAVDAPSVLGDTELLELLEPSIPCEFPHPNTNRDGLMVCSGDVVGMLSVRLCDMPSIFVCSNVFKVVSRLMGDKNCICRGCQVTSGNRVPISNCWVCRPV